MDYECTNPAAGQSYGPATNTQNDFNSASNGSGLTNSHNSSLASGNPRGIYEEANGEEGEDSDEMEFFGDVGFHEDEIAELDPEFYEFRSQLLHFRNEVKKLKDPQSRKEIDQDTLIAEQVPGYSSQSQNNQEQPPAKKQPTKPKFRRGPRKAAEPTPDIKRLLGEANDLWLKRNYEAVKHKAAEVVRRNAETYEAWNLLAGAFRELGDIDNTFKAMFFAAHLRPKLKLGWWEAAQFALNETGALRESYLQNAQFCLGSAIRADPEYLEARLLKAKVMVERHNHNAAISEYKNILARLPHDTEILQAIAEQCFEAQRLPEAIALYKEALAHAQTSPSEESAFGWDDADIYITLYENSRLFITAIDEIKSIARWLLGRGDEKFWAEFTSNDSEWDRDDSRRLRIPEFVPGKYPRTAYGEGLPLEFRVKLGICRLQLGHVDEAMLHLNWLDPQGGLNGGNAADYFHLFRLVGDELYKKGYHQKALVFYEPLRQDPAYIDAELLSNMGTSYFKLEKFPAAEECFKAGIAMDESDIPSRVGLAKLYEEINQPEEALLYVNEIMKIRKKQAFAPPNIIAGLHAAGVSKPPKTTSRTSQTPNPNPRPYVRQERRLDTQRQIREAGELQSQYFRLRRDQEKMRNGDMLARQSWMEAARILVEDFRSFKTFYPWDKYIRFMGYSDDAKVQAEISLEEDLKAMEERLSRGLGFTVPTKDKEKPNVDPNTIPKDYRGISFSAWLDIFLEYALCLAKSGNSKKSYDICEAAKDAVVFYHDREALFLIHLTWCMCALISNDEEACVGTARFFMKDYQFTTDSYRMFAAITRACQSPVSWYSSGPSQKYILRQIKAMDYALVDEESREKFFHERGSYSSKKDDGEPYINQDMDIALLMLYGHILFTGQSYAFALNYFFRAYALDPENPIINLNIGLAYIHHALKRQAENRQHIILQGLAFLLRYYNNRRNAIHLEERQEAHYNMGRIYHTLGLFHVAIPYYQKVLEEGANEPRPQREDLVLDTAYNLQTIYFSSGNLELAEKVTTEYLTI